MKSIQVITSFIFLFVFALNANAQTKTSTFKVSGNCGMCKKTIEGAAKNSGATYASWDVDSKVMTVKYASAKTSVDKIQKGVADAGYDNEKFTGSDVAYSELPGCCKYDRKTAVVAGEAKACCMKDGKCTGDKECCKKMEDKADCCVNGTCAKAGGCCSTCEKSADCCKKEGTVAKADCCKDGKCTHH